MEVGSLTATAEITGLDKIERAVNEMKSSMDKVSKSMDGMSAASKKVAGAATDAANAKKKMREEADKASSSTANLGRFTRELTTSLIGVNVIGITVGTTLGNLGTQIASRLALGIANLASQFSRLRNEMAQTTSFQGRIGQEMQFVIDQANRTGASVEDMSKKWTEFARAIEGSVTPNIEQARGSFVKFNEAIAANKIPTVSGALTNAGNAFAAFAAGNAVTNELGNIMITILNGIALALKAVTNNLGLATTEQEKFAAARKVENKNMEAALKEIIDLEAMRNSRFVFEGSRVKLMQRFTEQANEAAEALRKIDEAEAALKVDDPAKVEAKRSIIAETNRLLAFELDMTTRTADVVERETRGYQIGLQIRQLGLRLTEQEIVAIRARMDAVMINNRMNKEMHQQATMAFEELQGVLTGFGGVFTGHFNIMRDGVTGLADDIINVLLPATQTAMDLMEKSMIKNSETEGAIYAMKRRLAKQEQEQILHTASLAAAAITSLWPKSKAAAIAAAIINTAVGVTKALSSAPPPLNFINAALVAAAGAGQIMAIRSTSPTGGGSTPGVGAPPSPTAPPDPGVGGRTVTIRMEGGQLFSSQQLAEFISRINDEVQNGATLIATETT